MTFLKHQVAPLTAAVIVTTPQKLASIDVAKGVRMFSKLKVCNLT
jgi:Mrp family chromosome partitioning ATPase